MAFSVELEPGIRGGREFGRICNPAATVSGKARSGVTLSKRKQGPDRGWDIQLPCSPYVAYRSFNYSLFQAFILESY